MKNARCNLVVNLILLLCIISRGLGQKARLLQATRQGTTPQTCGANDWGPKCADCLNLLTCAGEQINIQTCSSINSQRPYCDLTSNACVASIDNSQSCVPQDYKCTGHGQFPDPSNCRRYYICDAPNAAPLGVYECPANYVYNSKTGLCVRSICQNIDCSKTPNQYIISSADPSILIYCFSGNNVQKPYVFRCPDPQNMQYDKDSLKCVYKCTREGRFADRVKCTGFYDCFWSIYGYQYNHNTCPSGYAFNASSLQCVQATTCKNQVDGQEVSTTSTPSPQ